MASTYVAGLAELERKLKDLDLKVAKNAVRRSAAAGARVIRDAVRRRAPRGKTGELQAGIGVSTRASLGKGQVTAKIRPNRKPKDPNEPSPAYKTLWLEEGTKAHEITTQTTRGRKRTPIANPKKVMADKAAGKIYGRKVSHPGLRARDFMKGAADESWPRAVEVFKETLTQAVNDAVRK